MSTSRYILPAWISQVPQIDYSDESMQLGSLQDWCSRNGWSVSDGSSLPFELRTRTDVLLEQSTPARYVRVAVMPKRKGRPGIIRLDSSSLRTIELVYQPKSKQWRVEIATVPIADDLSALGWDGIMKLLFRP